MRRHLLAPTILVLVALAAAPRPARAEWEVGLKAGATASNLLGELGDLIDPAYKAGFAGGAFVALPLTRDIALQAEAIYTQKGAKTTIDFTDDTGVITGTGDVFVEFDYLEVPVLLRVDAGRTRVARPYVFAGPTMAFALDGRYRVEGLFPAKVSLRDDMKNLDLCATMGAGIVAGEDETKFLLEARYTVGLGDLYDIAGNLDSINSTFTLCAGVVFSPSVWDW